MIGDRARTYALLAPAMGFIAIGFLLPVAWFLARSLSVKGGVGFDHYAEFFSSPLNREVFWRTLRIGLEVTLTCAAIGYAVALAIAEGGQAARGRWLGLIVLPLMISPVARTYAWIVILGRTGPITI